MKTQHSQKNRCGYESWGGRGWGGGSVTSSCDLGYSELLFQFRVRGNMASISSQALQLWASSHFSWEGLYQILLTYKHPIFWCEGTVHELKCLYLAPLLQRLADQRQVSSHFTVPGQIQLFKFKQHFKCFSCLKKKKMVRRSGWLPGSQSREFISKSIQPSFIEAGPGPG